VSDCDVSKMDELMSQPEPTPAKDKLVEALEEWRRWCENEVHCADLTRQKGA